MPKRWILLSGTFLFAWLLQACNFPSATPLFFDDFEDNNLAAPAPGWLFSGGSLYTLHGSHDSVDPPVNYVMTLFGGGSPGGGAAWRQGYQHDLADFQPTTVSFLVIPCSADPGSTYASFELSGVVPNAGEAEAIHLNFLRAASSGEDVLYLNGAMISSKFGCALYRIEFRGITWNTNPPVFDLYVDGSQVAACVPFNNPVESFSRLYLYNVHSGHSSWDEILMKDDPSLEGMASCPLEGDPPPPPPPEPMTPSPSPSPTEGTASPSSPTPTATFSATPTFTPLPPTATPSHTHTATTTATTPTGGGDFSSIVYQDSNSNGVFDPGEGRLPGVTVFLGQGACPSTGYRSTVTNSNGQYSFENVPNGTYCLSTDVVPVCETHSIATTQEQFTFTLGSSFEITLLRFGYGPYVC